MASGGGSGSGGGSYNKVGALLLAAIGGVVGFIIWSGGGGGDHKSGPAPTSVPQVIASPRPASTLPPASSNPQPGAIDKQALKRGDSNSVVITITAFGMPARVSVQAQNASEVKSQGMFDAGRGVDAACIPDTQYPNPCVTYLVVQRGAVVNVTAGNSLAGFWPELDYLRGGGCDREGTGGRDVSCSLTLFQEADLIAMYYGSDTPTGRYQFPKCPVGESRQRAAASSTWVARCQ